MLDLYSCLTVQRQGLPADLTTRLKTKTLAIRSNKRKAKKDMEIETEFALFSKKIKLNALNPDAAASQGTSEAPPEVEEVVNLVIPKRDPRFATYRELSTFVAENQAEVTEGIYEIQVIT